MFFRKRLVVFPVTNMRRVICVYPSEKTVAFLPVYTFRKIFLR